MTWNVGRSARARRSRRSRILRENSREIRLEVYTEPDRDRDGEALPNDFWDVCQAVLSPRQMEVIRLVLTGKLTDWEVAERLEIAKGTVRGHRNEATETLKQVFREREREREKTDRARRCWNRVLHLWWRSAAMGPTRSDPTE